MRFLNPNNGIHRRVWISLLLEMHEFGGILEDTRENIERENPMGLTVMGHIINDVLRDHCEITTAEELEEWERRYHELLDPQIQKLEIRDYWIERAEYQNQLDSPPDTPWIDPAGGIHMPDEVDGAKQYE